MTDLISRQAAIDAAIQAVDEWDGLYPQDRNMRIRNAIYNLPSAQQWIPISVEKPEQGRLVLVCEQVKKYHIGFLSGVAWYFFDLDMWLNEQFIQEFAWMYIPEPWGGGNNESIH